MAKNLDQIMAPLPAESQAKIESLAAELATLKDLRLEKRSDILLSTVRGLSP